MTIIHSQSAATSAPHGPATVGARAAAGGEAAAAFDALFALGIEAQSGAELTQPQTRAQLQASLHTPAQPAADAPDGDDPALATDTEQAAVEAVAVASLPPGLVLPALPAASARGAVPGRSDAPAAQVPAAAAQAGPAIAPAAPRAQPAAASDAPPERKPPARSERAEAVLAALQPPGKGIAETISAAGETPALPAGADKAAVQALPATQMPQSMLRETPGAAAAAATHEVRVPLDTPEWGEAFAQRVMIAAGRHEHSAEIRINPQHLGPIEVSLTLGGEDTRQASVHFSAVHAPVREAIEAALPRLREMFEQAGIQLGNATVGAETSGRESGGDARRGGGTSPGAAADSAAPALVQRVSEGMVDIFA